MLPSTDEISTRCPEPLLVNISSAVSICTSAATRLVSMVFLFAHSLPEPSRRSVADAGVDDDAVDAAELIAEFGEDLRHLLVVPDVQRGDRDR